MAAEGELSGRRATRVCGHLAACSCCRARLAEMKDTIIDFLQVHHKLCGPALPPIPAARAQLRVRLAELAGKPKAGLSTHFSHVGMFTRVAAYICLLLFAISRRLSARSPPTGLLPTKSISLMNGLSPWVRIKPPTNGESLTRLILGRLASVYQDPRTHSLRTNSKKTLRNTERNASQRNIPLDR
jgi:anti-sigma factor RsiW